MLIVIIGESGAGKTMLRNHLCDRYGFRHASSLSKKPVPEDERVVVEWPLMRPATPLPCVTMDKVPLMTSGRDLVGHVELLGGIVIEVSKKHLSGIGVMLPSGTRGVDDGRLLRTADRLMELLDVTSAEGSTSKEFGATALLGKDELDVVLAVLKKPHAKKRGPATRRAIVELKRARATLER